MNGRNLIESNWPNIYWNANTLGKQTLGYFFHMHLLEKGIMYTKYSNHLKNELKRTQTSS